MALAFDSRRVTRNVDALFEPHGIVHEEALAVAADLGLPRWWLNEQASTYVAPGGDPAASRVFDHPGLRVFAASPEHLLAMKAFAARPRDTEDIRQLIRVLDLHTADEVFASVREIFPEQEPPQRLGLLPRKFTTQKWSHPCAPLPRVCGSLRETWAGRRAARGAGCRPGSASTRPCARRTDIRGRATLARFSPGPGGTGRLAGYLEGLRGRGRGRVGGRAVVPGGHLIRALR
jgi:hypothetical protein